MTDWTGALCAGNPDPWTMPEPRGRGKQRIYTPEGLAKIEAAREACWRCPMIDACRDESAYADPSDEQIWAGLTPDEGTGSGGGTYLDPTRDNRCGTDAGYNWPCPEAAAIVPLLAELEARVRADEAAKIAEYIGIGKSVLRSIDKRIVMHNKHADELHARAEAKAVEQAEGERDALRDES